MTPAQPSESEAIAGDFHLVLDRLKRTELQPEDRLWILEDINDYLDVMERENGYQK